MVNTEEAKQMKSGIDIKGTIRDKEEIRTVNTRNGETKVCGAYLEDDVGRIKVTLWGDDSDRVKDGDVVEFGGAYTTEFRGEKQLQKGRNSGKLEVISG
jgi:ssDNA-binding replication factor A large subunit|tara:strand:- start:370 stop:666 length:297 start_codon:yes stop_codon:yes gene_type:complete